MLRWISLLLILFAVNAYANCTVVVGQPTGAAPTCNVSTNELGVRGEGASNTTSAEDRIGCNLVAPDCSGKLYTAAIYHFSTGNDNVKVCVYSDDGDSAPDSGDDLVICSGAIASGSSNGWKTDVLASNPSVATGTNYWLCIISDSTAWAYIYTGSVAQKYLVQAGAYANPPATLDPGAGSWGNVSDRSVSVYVTVGD
jgi:hypothetical protein